MKMKCDKIIKHLEQGELHRKHTKNISNDYYYYYYCFVCTHLFLWAFQSLAELVFYSAEIKHNFFFFLHFLIIPLIPSEKFLRTEELSGSQVYVINTTLKSTRLQ